MFLEETVEYMQLILGHKSEVLSGQVKVREYETHRPQVIIRERFPESVWPNGLSIMHVTCPPISTLRASGHFVGAAYLWKDHLSEPG
jgi:hypothetical protein